MLYLESALILPYYYLAYHSGLLVVALFWCFVALQVVINAAASIGRLSQARWPS
jgi:hypothetical protein